MSDPDRKIKTIYIGTVSENETQIALRAARECGFGIETYGPGKHYNPTNEQKEINISNGSEGLLLSCPSGFDPSQFWEKFIEIKGASVTKESGN